MSNMDTAWRKYYISVCKSYLGCKESDGSHKKIIDIYNSVTPLPVGYRVTYTDSWCATYVSAMAIKAGLADKIIPRECGCGRFITLCQNMGIWHENENYVPTIGDIILYDWQDGSNYASTDNQGGADHIGVVTDVSGNTITVIEGNKNDSVSYRTLEVNGRYIRGYAIPKYGDMTTLPPGYVEDTASSPSPAPAASTTVTNVQRKGVDVSTWNGSIDWKKVKAAGIDFAIIRAGYGKNNIDSWFKTNALNAIANGVFVGFYWFSYAVNAAEAKAEADYLCDAVESLGIKPSYPLCYDYEYDSVDKAKAKGYNPTSADIKAMGKAFMDEIEARGYYAANYTNIDFLGRGFSELTDRYDTWLAQWGASAPSRKCGMWQYTDKGTVNGIAGVVDMNISYYDYPTIISKMHGASTTDTQPAKEEVKPVEPVQPAKVYPYGKASETTGILKKGSTGTGVKAVQYALNKLGHQNWGTKGCDGKYGAYTKSAVKAFQKKAFPNQKSEWDGEVGPKTRKAFKDAGY